MTAVLRAGLPIRCLTDIDTVSPHYGDGSLLYAPLSRTKSALSRKYGFFFASSVLDHSWSILLDLCEIFSLR